MFNKIYSKVKEFIHDEWKFILFVLLLCFLYLYPVDCYVTVGGGIFSAADRVTVEGGQKEKGSFNLSYVSQLKGTLGTYLLSYIIPSYEREDVDDYRYNDSESVDDIELRNELLLKDASNNAIYVAYTNANKEITLLKNDLYVYNIAQKAVTDLEIGDKILEVNGKKVDDVDKIIDSLDEIEINEVVSIEVLSDGKKVTKTATAYGDKNKVYLGFSVMASQEYKTKPSVEYKFKEQEYGPSGGLMTALEIYNQLTKKDLTGGKKIAGTGTISRDGVVGEIDGIKYKLSGAVKNKADIFIAPTGDNYKEAVKEKKKNKYKIKLIEAKDFKQVVQELDKLI